MPGLQRACETLRCVRARRFLRRALVFSALGSVNPIKAASLCVSTSRPFVIRLVYAAERERKKTTEATRLLSPYASSPAELASSPSVHPSDKPLLPPSETHFPFQRLYI